LASAFLNHKHDLLDAGELSPRTWAQYKETCELLVEQLGKQRLVSDLALDDFAALRRRLAKRWRPGTLGHFASGRGACFGSRRAPDTTAATSRGPRAHPPSSCLTTPAGRRPDAPVADPKATTDDLPAVGPTPAPPASSGRPGGKGVGYPANKSYPPIAIPGGCFAKP
jgi:hypothetical protein